LVEGDQGKVLVTDSRVAHVLWATGVLAGDVSIVDHEDLRTGSTRSVSGSLDDSLELGGLTSFSSRQVWDDQGHIGVLNVMVEGGHLASFIDIAEEALGIVAHRIRHDASFQAIAGELDDSEAETLVRTAAAALIRDAFAAEEED
jgi:hypothetical protein